MACGVPVIVADNSSLPEIAGGAACLIPTDDTNALASALKALIISPSLRANLKQKGFQRPPKYTWEKAAQELLVVYQSQF